ncbi:MAG: DUF4214 domain-containing protein, partial [Sterolibacterium sp.]
LSKNDYHVAITFKSDGTYMQAEDGPVDGSSGHTGMDSGTYTWNSATGALTCTTTLETDGGWSLSNAQVNSVIVNGDSAILHSPTEGDNTFSRVIASQQPVAASANTAPSFAAGGSGKVTTDFGVGDFGASVALQSDGKILLAGTINDDFALLRYNANGSLDTSFDGDGKVATDMGGSDAGHGIALQADGKILVAGEVAGNNTNYGLVRYDVNGTLDTSFAGSGKVITDFGGGEKANSITLQPDGKILVAGDYTISSNTGSSGGYSLARYNADGSLDTSFDNDGKLTTNFGGGGNGYGIALQTDGKILVTGNGYIGGVDRNDMTLARYNADGSLDASFDGDGKLTTDFGGAEYGMSVMPQADGKILVAGVSFIGSNNVALARYNTDGSLDTSFDGDGKVTTDLGGSDHGFAIALQADGKILVAGDGGSNADFALTRYNTDGSLDVSFDGDGKLTTDFGGTDESYSIRLQSDGKILIAGTRSGATDSDFALARYNSDGSLDTSFGSGSSNTLDGAPSYSENNSAVVLDNSVQVVDTELAALGNYAGATLTLSRHGGANAEDSYAATGSLSTLTQGGNLVYGGTSIGTVSTNASGTLLLTFNSNATQTLVNNTLSAIAYANSSDTPPASVQIDWNFSDGNSGDQGTGATLAATGTTTVSITPANDAPVNATPLVQVATTDQDHVVAGVSITDPDANSLQITLSAGHGVLSLSSISGLSFTTGDGSADTRMVFSGSKASVNAALNNFIYHGQSDFLSGTDFVSLMSSDQGGAGAGGTLTDSSMLSVFVVGAEGTEAVTGGTGDDTLAGGSGNEMISGGEGSDNLAGGSGNDVLLGGAGNDVLDGGPGADSSAYSGTRAHYSVATTATGITVTDNSGSDGMDTLNNVEQLRFYDMTVNLVIQAKVAATLPADVQSLTELYVAFFNRVPDADGLSYWIDQKAEGQSIGQIAETFYNAGVQYTSLTGFSASMTNQDFINVVYRNVLGRSGGADQGGLDYWNGELVSGRATHGSLVSDILNSAHSFKHDPTYGYVADLLDNKVAVANKFAIDLGLNYNSASDSIANGMAIAAAVTSTSTADAITLIGIPGVS